MPMAYEVVLGDWCCHRSQPSPLRARDYANEPHVEPGNHHFNIIRNFYCKYKSITGHESTKFGHKAQLYISPIL